MSSSYQAHINSYTSSISVNGKNQISVSVKFTDKKSGYFENEVYIEFGSKYFYKFLGTSPETISYTIPIEWLNEIPDSVRGTGKIRVQCVNMSTAKVEYQEVKNFTVYVPEEFKPTVSNLKVERFVVNGGLVDYMAYGLVRPLAKAKVTPHSTSPIKKWYISGGGVTASGEAVITSGSDYNLIARGELIRTFNPTTTFELTVEDCRGRSASITSEEFDVQPYNRPIVKSLIAYRTDMDGIQKTDGGYIKVTVEGGISPIRDSDGNEINTLKCYLSWAKANESYGNFIEITNNEPYIFEADKDINFEIKVTLRDKYMETVAYANVTGDLKDFNIVDGGGGAAIGMKATKDYFDVAHKTRLQKNLSVKEEVTSGKGFVSTGTGSRGDFLSFGEARRILAFQSPGGFYYGDDFNDYTNIGVYGVYRNADISPAPAYGAQILNIPVQQKGTLRVYNATGQEADYATERYLMQEYVVYDGSAVYRRCLSMVRDNSDVDWPLNWTFGSWYCYSGTKI